MKVTWFDAWCDAEESRPSDWKTSMPCETVGFLVRERPVVSVAAERVDDESYRAVTHIPRPMVRRIERL